jgi:hypothetical protein
MHTKFHKDWVSHSKVDKRGYTDTKTQKTWRTHKPALGKWAKMLLYEYAIEKSQRKKRHIFE